MQLLSLPQKIKESSNKIEIPLKKSQPLLNEEQDLSKSNEALEKDELNVVVESQEPTETVATNTTVTLIKHFGKRKKRC